MRTEDLPQKDPHKITAELIPLAEDLQAAPFTGEASCTGRTEKTCGHKKACAKEKQNVNFEFLADQNSVYPDVFIDKG